jgi:hypothetical protein
MANFQNYQAEGTTEVLDGNEYLSCDFRNCTLIYRGGLLPKINQCNFTGCNWKFEDAAERTLVFLTAIYHGGTGMTELVEKTFDNIRRGNPGPS